MNLIFVSNFEKNHFHMTKLFGLVNEVNELANLSLAKV